MTSWAISIIVALACPINDDRADEQGGFAVSLHGRWTGTAPHGTKITYDFSKDGGLTWFVEDENFKQAWPKGLKAKYSVRVAKPFWEIDMVDFDDERFKGIKLLGIPEVIDSRTFKMDGEPGNRGKRPKEFGEDAVTFKTGKSSADAQ